MGVTVQGPSGIHDGTPVLNAAEPRTARGKRCSEAASQIPPALWNPPSPMSGYCQWQPGRPRLPNWCQGALPQQCIRREGTAEARRLEEVAKAVMGGYCRLQMPFKPALAVRGTIPRYILGALEAPSSLPFPMHPCPPPPPPVGAESFNEAGPRLPPLPPLRHTRPAPAGRRP